MGSIFAELPKPDYKNHIEYYNGINPDIRTVLEKNLPEAIKQAAPLAPYFKGSTPRETARNIWNYLRKAITYKQDEPGYQDLVLPRRFHAQKFGDCKSYTLNSLAIYKAIYPHLAVSPKYAAYRAGAKIPTHVYGVVKDEQGNNIIIDGCYFSFDNEKKFTLALPLNFDMVIRTLSGITPLPAIFNETYDLLPGEKQREIRRALEHAAKFEVLRRSHEAGDISLQDCLTGLDELQESIGKTKKTKEEKKAARKRRRKKAGLFFKKLGRGLAFITLAPIRGAFAAIIAANVNGLASNLRLVKEANDKSHWQKLVNFWKNVGGLEKAFNKAVQLGTKHKALWMGKKAHKKFLERAKAEGKEAGKGAKEKWLRGLEGPDGYDEGIKGYDLTPDELAKYITGLASANNFTESELNGYLTGLDSEGIAFPPAVAAAVALGSSMLAGIIPILKVALDKTGHKKEAAGVEGEAEDLRDSHNAGELRVTEDMIPTGEEAPDAGNEPANPDEQGDFDAPPESLNGLGAVQDSYVIMDDLDSPLSDFASTMNDLGPIFQKGLSLASDVVQHVAKKKPKLKKMLDQGETYADDYFTNLAVKKAGAKWRQTSDQVTGQITKYLPYAAGAAALLFIANRFTPNRK